MYILVIWIPKRRYQAMSINGNPLRITYSVVDAAGNVTETTERIVTISEKPAR